VGRLLIVDAYDAFPDSGRISFSVVGSLCGTFTKRPLKNGVFPNRRVLPISENAMTTLEVPMKEGNGSLREEGYEALSTYCYYQEKSRTLRIQMLLFNKDQQKSSMTIIQDAFHEACRDNNPCNIRVFQNSYLVLVSNRARAQAIAEILEKKCLGERKWIKDMFQKLMLFLFRN